MNTAIADSLPDFDALWDYNKPAETESRFREILNVAEKSGDSLYIAELKTQIARTLGLQQKFDEAHRVLDDVEAAFSRGHNSSASSAWDRVRIRYMLERGRIFNSAKQKDKARPLFEAAWELGRTIGQDGFAVDAAHMMAIAADSGLVMAWNQKALALAEKSSDSKARRWRASLYNNIGWDYFSQGNYDSALSMFEKAVPARIEQQQPTEVRIAKWCVAKAQRMLGRIDDALAIQRELEIDWRESGEGEDGFVFEEIAECLLSKGDSADARPYFARAYRLLSADIWLSRDEPARLVRLKELGGVSE
jgi:tetratricopeptide (TPR) repeat protein